MNIAPSRAGSAHGIAMPMEGKGVGVAATSSHAVLRRGHAVARAECMAARKLMRDSATLEGLAGMHALVETARACEQRLRISLASDAPPQVLAMDAGDLRACNASMKRLFKDSALHGARRKAGCLMTHAAIFLCGPKAPRHLLVPVRHAFETLERACGSTDTKRISEAEQALAQAFFDATTPTRADWLREEAMREVRLQRECWEHGDFSGSPAPLRTQARHALTRLEGAARTGVTAEELQDHLDAARGALAAMWRAASAGPGQAQPSLPPPP